MSRAQRAEPDQALTGALLDLGQGRFEPHHLQAFNDLSREHMKVLRVAWPLLPEETRLELVQAASTQAESNIEFDFERLYRVALDDEAPEIRAEAVDGLWTTPSSDLKGIFLQLLESDPSEEVRQRAASALAPWVDALLEPWFSAGPDQDVIERLKDVASDADVSLWLRRRALESVAAAPEDAEIAALIEDAYDSPDDAVKAGALYAMGRTGSVKYLPVLVNEMASDDAEMRFEAARAAGAIGDIAAVPVLAELVSDPDAEVRMEAVSSLGEIGGPAAIRILERLLARAERGSEEAAALTEALTTAEIMDDPLGGEFSLAADDLESAEDDDSEDDDDSEWGEPVA